MTRLFQRYSAVRYETRRYILVLIPVLVALVLFIYSIRQPLLVGLASALACFAIASLYEIKQWRRICLSVLAAATFGCCDYFLEVILQFAQFDVQQNSFFGIAQSIIFIILSKLLAMSILNLLHARNFFQSETFSATFSLAAVTVPVFSFITLYLLHQATVMLDTLFYRIMILITAILLLGTNLVLFYVLDRYEMFDLAKQSLHFTQIHLQDQLGHYNDLFHSHKELRRFRHDLRADSLKYIELLQHNRVEEVIEALHGTVEQIERQSKGPTTGHSRIDMIVSEMQRKAKPLGFQIQFFFQESAPICMDEMKLCILLANVIQNGIDACT
ncbi:MAG: hypothetical protein LIO46_01505, partial [Clostridiales bacterium]|nr:hypothetical protein [Clostridiales bacterium]